jgi:PIN domain nuclease of toxin-antitoxin system
VGDAQVIVLDTHVWIWWVDNNPRLSREVRDRINSDDELRVSAISLWEIATLFAMNRLALRPSEDRWFEVALSATSLRIEPLTVSICLESARLPGELHRDPADRLIVALARQIAAPLCTADRKLLAYPHVNSINAEA